MLPDTCSIKYIRLDVNVQTLHLLIFEMPIIYFVIRLFLLGYLPTFIIPI